MKKELHIGGQAVIEGVMIKSDNNYVVAVRKNKKILIKKKRIRKKKSKITKLLFIRGFVNLIDMLVIGTKTLIWSAEQQTDEKEEKISKKEIFFVIGLSFLIAVLFFMALPYFLTVLLGIKEETKPILFNLVDGFIRISFFLLYIFAISFLKDVRRLFQYHGAEHKAVNCFEAGKKLTVENVKKYSTLHIRCGTSFIVIVLIIAILVFSVLPPIVIYFFPNFLHLHIFFRKITLFFLRILMIIPIAAISYEFLKFSDKFKNNKIISSLSKPGLWLQRITTKQPSKRQIEVAIKAVKSILKLEKYSLKTKNI